MPEEKKNNLPESIKKLPKENQIKAMLRALLLQKIVKRAETSNNEVIKLKENK